jgi:hypothetical protein
MEKRMIDWKTLASARGLQLSDAELDKLASAMDALQPAYQSLVANLTPDVEPATSFIEEAIEGKEAGKGGAR